MKNTKKAISPIITTVLLVLVAMILAAIIFVWAKGFISEKIAKFIPSTGEDRPISEACDSVKLSAEITGNSELALINNGDIPVYKVGVRVVDSTSGSASVVEYDTIGLDPGQTKQLATTQTLQGNKISIVPILIGKSEKKGTVEYNCKNYLEVAQ